MPELIPLVLIILLAGFLRTFNLHAWLLANVDEISLMNNLGLPLLSGGFASTTFFFYVLLTKAFFFIGSFPDLRYISVVTNLAGLVLAYKAAKLVTDRKRALLLTFVLSIQWYYVYISRLFEIGALTPFFTSAIFYLYFKWEKTKSNSYIYLAYLASGLALCNHVPPMVYFLISMNLWMIYLLLKRQIKFSTLFKAALIFALAISPYIYVITFVNSLEKGVTAFYSAENKSVLRLENIYNSQTFLKTLTELFTFYQTDVSWTSLLAPVIIIVSLPIVLFIFSERTRDLNFLFWQTYLTLALILFSVAPAYNEGHFSAFLMSFIFLAVKLTESRKKIIFYSSLAVVIFLSFFSILFFKTLSQDQYRQLEWLPNYISDNDLKEVLISDGAYLSLKHTQFLDGVDLKVFTCNPIAGITENDLREHKLIIATFDCNLREQFIEIGLKEIVRINTLMEANLSHGIIVYEN